jgi:hypothetical protein
MMRPHYRALPRRALVFIAPQRGYKYRRMTETERRKDAALNYPIDDAAISSQINCEIELLTISGGLRVFLSISPG